MPPSPTGTMVTPETPRRRGSTRCAIHCCAAPRPTAYRRAASARGRRGAKGKSGARLAPSTPGGRVGGDLVHSRRIRAAVLPLVPLEGHVHLRRRLDKLAVAAAARRAAARRRMRRPARRARWAARRLPASGRPARRRPDAPPPPPPPPPPLMPPPRKRARPAISRSSSAACAYSCIERVGVAQRRERRFVPVLHAHRVVPLRTRRPKHPEAAAVARAHLRR